MTGVQTCALPISSCRERRRGGRSGRAPAPERGSGPGARGARCFGTGTGANGIIWPTTQLVRSGDLAGSVKEMAKDPEQQSEHADQDQREDEVEEKVEVEAVTDPDRPNCPRCGWHNTRLSHTRSMLDSILRMFALRAFRCRSCGNRFRAFRRVPRK